jgi:large subunit ribosomal protein L29
MTFPKIQEIQNLTKEEIKNKIVDLEKELFELRFKRATRKPFKPHLFKHIKHRIAQLSMILKQKSIGEKK